MSNIIIPQDMLQLNSERTQLKRNQDEARNRVQTLNSLTGQLPTNATGTPQAIAPLTPDRTPIAELNATLPILQQTLSHVHQIETDIQDKRSQIYNIEQNARKLMMFTIAAVVIILLIVILVILHSVHMF